MKAWDFIKKRLQHRCFPINIPKFLNTENTCKQLLLSFYSNCWYIHWMLCLVLYLLYQRKGSFIKVGLSLSKKICVICLIESPVKMLKNAYFILKAFFVLKVFKFLSRPFGHVGKRAWFEKSGQLQNSWRHNLVYVQLQYTYCPLSQKVKAARQWNMVN